MTQVQCTWRLLCGAPLCAYSGRLTPNIMARTWIILTSSTLKYYAVRVYTKPTSRLCTETTFACNESGRNRWYRRYCASWTPIGVAEHLPRVGGRAVQS